MFVFHFNPKGSLEPDSKATHQPLWHRYRRHMLIFSHSSFKLNASSKHHSVQCSSSVLYLVHSAGRQISSSSHSGSLALFEQGSSHQNTRHILVSQRKRVSHSTASATPTPNITHTHSHIHASNPSKCHRLCRTLQQCQRFRGPRINITSFLSIRAYLFPSSYCTSASHPICIPGKSPDESRPRREGKTE